MIAIQYIIENRSANFLENFVLGTFSIEYIIKHKRYLFVPWVFDYQLTFVTHSMYFIRIINEFFRVEGPEPAEDFYVPIAFFLHRPSLLLVIDYKQKTRLKG